ncbi:MAG TPA: hypothetical protein DCX14_11255 [Flavobacteriales bacterium]|jgi:hypothetical protein|nr:glycosyltransferase [Flavobacteriales bacterium]HAW20751.1 hypothetical protein [Flavobacteriales bacterium]
MTSIPHIAVLLDNPFVSDLRVEKEINSFIQAGMKVTLFCFKSPELPDSVTREDGLEIKRIFNFWLYHPLRLDYKKRINAAAQIVAQSKPTAVHCHDFYSVPVGGALKELDPSIFFVYDTHEYFRKSFFYQEIPEFFNRIKGNLSWRKLIRQERNLSRQADLVISTTHAICDAIRSNYRLKCPMIPVRNIPAIEASGIAGNKLRDRLDIPEGKIMVQSGNVYQSLELMLSMFDEVISVPNLSFVLIGNRPKFYSIKEEALKIPKYAGRIFFLDYDPNHLHDHLSSADFGLLYMRTDVWESHKLTSPNRVMEYSVCGIPFISVPQYSSESLRDEFGHVLFFDASVSGDLARNINVMIDNYDMLKLGAEKANATLSWSREFEPVLEMYRARLA